jgi:hypothetical protein
MPAPLSSESGIASEVERQERGVGRGLGVEEEEEEEEELYLRLETCKREEARRVNQTRSGVCWVEKVLTYILHDFAMQVGHQRTTRRLKVNWRQSMALIAQVCCDAPSVFCT